MLSKIPSTYFHCINVPLFGACFGLALLIIQCGSNKTPQMSDFDNIAGYPYDLSCTVSDVKGYLQNYFINRRIPVEVKNINESTFIVTGYDDEPGYDNRIRFAAYLVQISPDSSTNGSKVTFKWFVTSRGVRERTLRPTDKDKEYAPKYASEIPQQVQLFINTSCGQRN